VLVWLKLEQHGMLSIEIEVDEAPRSKSRRTYGDPEIEEKYGDPPCNSAQLLIFSAFAPGKTEVSVTNVR
jgi:hypothetical protein